jgi:hypothetical protein
MPCFLRLSFGEDLIRICIDELVAFKMNCRYLS